MTVNARPEYLTAVAVMNGLHGPTGSPESDVHVSTSRGIHSAAFAAPRGLHRECAPQRCVPRSVGRFGHQSLRIASIGAPSTAASLPCSTGSTGYAPCCLLRNQGVDLSHRPCVLPRQPQHSAQWRTKESARRPQRRCCAGSPRSRHRSRRSAPRAEQRARECTAWRPLLARPKAMPWARVAAATTTAGGSTGDTASTIVTTGQGHEATGGGHTDRARRQWRRPCTPGSAERRQRHCP